MRCTFSNSTLHGGCLTWAAPNSMLPAAKLGPTLRGAAAPLAVAARELSPDPGSTAAAIATSNHAEVYSRDPAASAPPSDTAGSTRGTAPRIPRGGTRTASTTPQLLAARAQQAHAAKSLTCQLRHAPTWRDLAQLFADHSSQMNHIHMSALLVRLAHLTTDTPHTTPHAHHPASPSQTASTAGPAKLTGTDKTSHAIRARDRPSVQLLLMRLVPYIGLHLLTFGPRQLSGAMWALGRMGFCPEPAWVAEWCACMARKLDTCTPQDVAMGAWGLVACGALQLDAPTGAPGLLLELARTAAQPGMLGRCQPQDVSNLVWALASAGVPVTRDVTRPFVVRALQLLGASSAKRAGAAAVLHGQLAGGSAAPAPTQLTTETDPQLQLQERAGPLWESGVPDRPHDLGPVTPLAGPYQSTMSGRTAQVQVPVAGCFSPQELSGLMWGLGQLGHHHGDQLLGGLLTHFITISHSRPQQSHFPMGCEEQAGTGAGSAKGWAAKQGQGVAAGPQQFATVLWAVAKLRYCPPPSHVVGLLEGLVLGAGTCATHTKLAASSGAVAGGMMGNSETSTGGSSSINSGSSVKGSDGSNGRTTTVPQAARPSAPPPPQLSNQDVSQALWALGSLRYIPPPRLLQPLLRSTYGVLLSTAATGGMADEPCVISDDEDGEAAVQKGTTAVARSSTPAVQGISVPVQQGGSSRGATGTAAGQQLAPQRRRVRLLLQNVSPATGLPMHDMAGPHSQSQVTSGGRNNSSSGGVGELTPMQLVSVLWGVSRLHVRLAPALRCALQASLAALAPDFSTLPPPALADAALAMARARVKPSKQVVGCLTDALAGRMHALGPHHLVRLLVALVELRAVTPAAFRQAAVAQAQVLMGSRHALALRAQLRARMKPGAGAAGGAGLPLGFSRAAGSRGARVVAGAAGTVGCSSWAGKQRLAAVGEGDAPFDVLLSRRDGPRVLLAMGWGLASLRCHSLPGAWADAFVAQAIRALSVLQVEEIERLVWCVCALRLRPDPRLGRAFAVLCMARARACVAARKGAHLVVGRGRGSGKRRSQQAGSKVVGSQGAASRLDKGEAVKGRQGLEEGGGHSPGSQVGSWHHGPQSVGRSPSGSGSSSSSTHEAPHHEEQSGLVRPRAPSALLQHATAGAVPAAGGCAVATDRRGSRRSSGVLIGVPFAAARGSRAVQRNKKEQLMGRVHRMLALWQAALVREEGRRPVGQARKYRTSN